MSDKRLDEKKSYDLAIEEEEKEGYGYLEILIIIGILFLVLLIGTGYILISPQFERVSPTIEAQNSYKWNLKDNIEITIKDNEKLKSYRVVLSDGDNNITLHNEIIETPLKEKKISIIYPTKGFKSNKDTLKLSIFVRDGSFWNLLKGNSVKKEVKLNIDTTRPQISILSHSYSITQGGSALVIFNATDKNLKDIYIEANGKKFEVTPYKKEGYFVSLIAWYFTENNFNAKVVATDSANNKRETIIPFYLKSKKYKESLIKARDKFINGKITDLASSNREFAKIEDNLEKFKAVNETMRLENEALIHGLTKEVSKELITEWKIKKFYPLRNGMRVASYGDSRDYYYKEKENKISHSYHLGYDLASTRMAGIKTSNSGVVVYASENGIYGNMPIINHGLGLYTLYGHCSQLLVQKGEKVKAGDVIARTGKTGLALGDHLHFGILVQGIEVRPVEWFDASWIEKNINKMFREADKIIKD